MGKLIARILIALGFSEATASKVGEIAVLASILSVVLAILSFIKKLAAYPLFLGAVCVALTLFPDTIGWIFLQLGNIQLKVMAIILVAIMPDIMGSASAEYDSWAQIWQQGLNLLPPDVVDVVNSIGVGYLLGLVTSTILAVSMIKVYRKIMFRAGLL